MVLHTPAQAGDNPPPPATVEEQANLNSNVRQASDRACILEFKQVRGPNGYVRIEVAKASFEFYSNNEEAGLKPSNPMSISYPATGPFGYGVTEQFARDYILLYPQGIDVPITDTPGGPTVHMEVSWRYSATPNPTKRRIDKDVLERISLHVQHYEIRTLAQFIKPQDVALGWMAHGFETVNARWGANKIKNESGEEGRAGHNSVVWVTIIPGENHGLFGAFYPTAIRVKLRTEPPTYTYLSYDIRPH